MKKPSVAELLTASGKSVSNRFALDRAISALYGNVGANIDERNWFAIMQSSDPLAAAENALSAQYQNKSYLLRNAEYIVSIGYQDFAPELTYRQLSKRLDYTYDNSWSDNTGFSQISQLSDASLESISYVYSAPPTPTPPPQYSFTAQSGATPAALSFINSSVSNQTFSAITGLSPLNSSDTLDISFNDGGNTLGPSQTLSVGHLNLNSAGIVTLNTTNGVGSSGAATFSGITDTGLTSLSITSPSSGPLTLGTITPAPSSLISLNADNVSGFLTVAFANGSFISGDISSPNIRGALGGGDYNLGDPSTATGIWLNGPTNIVRYASHTTVQQVFVSPGLTTNATIYGFGSASAQDYLKIDGGSTAVVVLDNDTHLNAIKIDVQGNGNLTISGLKGGDNIWVDAPANLNATATGPWTPTINTANDGSASINANGNAINLQNVLGTNGWTITNGGSGATLKGSAYADTITGGTGNDTIIGGAGIDAIDGGSGTDTADYSSALKSDGTSLTASDTGITLTLNGSTSATVTVGSTNVGADTIRNVENIIGTGGKDTLTGDANANTLTGGAGEDILEGGLGTDSYVYNNSGAAFVDANADVIIAFGAGSGVNFDILRFIDSADLQLAGNATQTFQSAAINNFTAGRGNNVIVITDAVTNTAAGIQVAIAAINTANGGAVADGGVIVVAAGSTGNAKVWYDAAVGSGDAVELAELDGFPLVGLVDFMTDNLEVA